MSEVKDRVGGRGFLPLRRPFSPRKWGKALEEKKRRESAHFMKFFSKVEKKKPDVAVKADEDLWYKPPMRAKLYQFHDNYRPPYYGTWRTHSKVITGRRPFSTVEETIDYEVDSDAEWEEEPSDAEECKSDEE
ncbi:hypothetical protein ANCDUO_19668, partial [Ancylostoma duodenale]